MHQPLVALAVAMLLFAAPGCTTSRSVLAVTPDETAVMATVQQFIDGFDAGDLKKARAACTDEMSIVDDLPPHEWHGVGAFDKWAGDYGAGAKKLEITDGVVTLGAARHIDVTADRAYLVVAADYAYKSKGAAVKESGSTLTVALQKSAAGWRITGFAWTKG